jgi:ribose 5-phosphate isomerase B
MTRCHNNSNVLTLGGRTVGPELAKDIVKEFLTAEFEGGRHQTRIDKIMELEN